MRMEDKMRPAGVGDGGGAGGARAPHRCEPPDGLVRREVRAIHTG